MGRTTKTSAVIDGLLDFMVKGGLVATAIVAPNALQALDKPLQKYFETMDERARTREWQRVTRYMRQQGLVNTYDHGLQITKKGRERAAQYDIDQLSIKGPRSWDKKWRMIFFDIPEERKRGRDQLTRKLKELGFYQLQRSVWIHPFPCRKEIEIIASNYKIDQYITYIETSFIDKQNVLKNKFKQIL